MTSSSSGEVLRRSSFQELIRRWELAHPYNFVCAADLAGKIDEASLEMAAIQTLAEMRLGAMRFAGGRRYSIEPVTRVEVRHVGNVEQCAEVELNRPFDDGAPIRVAFTPAHDGSTVSITFRHIVFDGYSGSVFARRMLLRALGNEMPPMEVGMSRRGRNFLADGYAWLNPQFCLRPIRDLWRMRNVYSRPPCDTSARVAIRFLRRDDRLLARIRIAADRPGVTVNDALATRFARGLLAIHGNELTGKRDAICLSVAVSLRRGVVPLGRGVDVAAFPVFVRKGDSPIAAVVRQQTDIEKRSRSYLRSLIGMGLAAAWWPTGGGATKQLSIPTAYVPTAGFTNVRLPSLPGDESMSNVRAVVSTGPILPMMLVAVTHGDDLRLALTWQAVRFAGNEIDLLESALLE